MEVEPVASLYLTWSAQGIAAMVSGSARSSDQLVGSGRAPKLCQTARPGLFACSRQTALAAPRLIAELQLSSHRANQSGRRHNAQDFRILKRPCALQEFIDGHLPHILTAQFFKAREAVKLNQRQPVDHAVRHAGGNRL